MVALARANQGKWNEAGQLFEELFKSYPKLAPYHAYNAARCRLRRGDAAGALEWAARVADGSVPKAEAELVRIDALRTLGRWSDALAALESYLQQWPNGPRRAESLFKKAEAMEKAAGGGGGVDARKAAPDVTAIYRRVWAEAPNDVWGDRAAERLEQIAAALPSAEAAVVRARTAGELMSRGMVLFDRNRNQESEAAFASALAAPGLDADLECRARFHRAQSVWKQRQRQRAAPLFDEAEVACGRAGNKDLHAKALYQGARSYSMSGNKEAALARFARVEAEHADHSYADDARVRAAEIATDAGDEATAAKLLAEVPTRYPKADMLNEALWRLAFAAWRAGRDRRGAALARRESAPGAARGDLVRGGPRPVLEGARVRKARQARRGARLVRTRRARVPAVGVRAAVAEPAQDAGSGRAEGADRGPAQGAARRARLVVSAARAVRRRRASCAPWSWRAWARASTPAAS